jgi:hypothetical protein
MRPTTAWHFQARRRYQSSAFTARQSAQCGLRFNAAYGRLRDAFPRLVIRIA